MKFDTNSGTDTSDLLPPVVISGVALELSSSTNYIIIHLSYLWVYHGSIVFRAKESQVR